MIKLIITNRLYPGVFTNEPLARLISLRPLVKKEIACARKMGIRRFYLPSLAQIESEVFFKEFDKFWDQAVEPFGSDHVFWRNIVSSKMQEWERSAICLAITLFTLSRNNESRGSCVVIVCSSLEEENVCEEWGKKMGWKVHRKPHSILSYWFRRVIQEARNLKNFLRMFACCLYQKWFSPKYKPENFPKKNQILIASLFYNNCFNDGIYLDPFFGNLHNTIKQNGKSVVYVAGPLDNYRESVKKVKECSDVFIAVPYSIISWGELISLAVRVFMRRVRLPRVDFCGCDFSKLIMWNARRFEYFFNFHSEIYYAAMVNLCKNEHFERLIQLYEGNVFERGCIQAFRKHSSGLIVGYSHAVVFPLNLKIRLTDNEKRQRPEPDVLVSTGPETKNLMVNIGRREPSSVFSGCSFRDIPAVDNLINSESIQPDILVPLDGTGLTILDWLIEYSELLKKYNVKLRGHPSVSFKRLVNQCLYNLPDNFRISNNDLQTDIKNSFCVIYRQTSVGLQALMNGVPAIHLDIDVALCSDPIMNLKVSKWTARSPEELAVSLQEIQSLGQEKRAKIVSVAKKYASEYFSFPDDKNIMKFLGSKRKITSCFKDLCEDLKI